MSTFCERCAISGLPIKEGDSIFYCIPTGMHHDCNGKPGVHTLGVLNDLSQTIRFASKNPDYDVDSHLKSLYLIGWDVYNGLGMPAHAPATVRVPVMLVHKAIAKRVMERGKDKSLWEQFFELVLFAFRTRIPLFAFNIGPSVFDREELEAHLLLNVLRQDTLKGLEIDE